MATIKRLIKLGKEKEQKYARDYNRDTVLFGILAFAYVGSVAPRVSSLMF
ncbi:hypothetical protein C2845_PM03G19870 [Panicum miliaceum]|uniref:Uncharacterized protein n=1 Tax=Panicum miliaceum TaxID=4540 RepID=A0A3L6T9W1_PANMI|nr:hypothetical protein C2845_PM03G19870 [Panicum miliaceum]